MAKEGEQYTGQSVRYHAMQPRHCFRNKGGTGLERDGFGGNGPKFINLDFILTGLNFIRGVRTPRIKLRLFYSLTGFRLDLDRSKSGLNRLYQFWQPPSLRIDEWLISSQYHNLANKNVEVV
jgi:hypothetical protein